MEEGSTNHFPFARTFSHEVEVACTSSTLETRISVVVGVVMRKRYADGDTDEMAGGAEGAGRPGSAGDDNETPLCPPSSSTEEAVTECTAYPSRHAACTLLSAHLTEESLTSRLNE